MGNVFAERGTGIKTKLENQDVLLIYKSGKYADKPALIETVSGVLSYQTDTDLLPHIEARPIPYLIWFRA
ncbi:hypothetical protein [Thermoflexibacter ruber]|uniref:hypothetical protein n=1 Tax=Thermoflexibacter ruber TaxID=1003 RepID=UPI000B85F2C8|nr:hypothetical protein [Thermoflexibacter ruber]